MRARVIQISNAIDVKELGAGNTAREELCLWIAAVCGQIPRGINNIEGGPLQL
jgi:hypothetical protein